MINCRKEIGSWSLASSRRNSIDQTNMSSLPRIQSLSRPTSRSRLDTMQHKLKMMVKEEETRANAIEKPLVALEEPVTQNEFANYKQLDTVILKNRLMTTIHFSSFSYRYLMLKIDPNFTFPALFKYTGSQPVICYVALNRKPTPDNFDMKTEACEFLIPTADDRLKKRVAVLMYSKTGQIGQVGVGFVKQAPTVKPPVVRKPQTEQGLVLWPEREEAKALREQNQVAGKIVHKKNMLIAGIFKDYTLERRQQTKLVKDQKLETAREIHALKLTQATEHKAMAIRYRQARLKQESLVREKLVTNLLGHVMVREWLRIFMFIELVPKLAKIVKIEDRRRALIIARESGMRKFRKKKKVLLDILVLMRDARLQSQNPVNNIFLYFGITQGGEFGHKIASEKFICESKQGCSKISKRKLVRIEAKVV